MSTWFEVWRFSAAPEFKPSAGVVSVTAWDTLEQAEADARRMQDGVVHQYARIVPVSRERRGNHGGETVIRTTKLSATHTRGERIKAKGRGMQVTKQYDYGLSTEAAHAAVARELARKLHGPSANVCKAYRGTRDTERGYAFYVVHGEVTEA